MTGISAALVRSGMTAGQVLASIRAYRELGPWSTVPEAIARFYSLRSNRTGRMYRDVECQFCDGEGRIYYDGFDPSTLYGHVESSQACEHCDGRGRIKTLARHIRFESAFADAWQGEPIGMRRHEAIRWAA